jgi:Ca2+-binding RTX toxin-like protein
MIPRTDDPLGSGVSGFTFADGTTLSMAQMIALAPPAPSFDAELLFQFQLGMGAQTIAPESATVVQFAQGIAASDVTVSHDGTDLVIASKDGTDSLRVTGWYDDSSALPKVSARFADGTLWNSLQLSGLGLIQDGSAGGETLTGVAGFSNTFIAGPNDTLVGTSGKDTYVFNAGAGTVHISDPGGNSVIRFGAGITPDMISLGVGSLLLRVGDNGDAIHVDGFDPSNALNSASIRNFRFDDGTTLTYDELVARGFDIYGGSGDETLTGTNLDNRIYAGTGNDVLIASGAHDTLYGGEGNDTLTGGAGVDLLVGGSGNNTLIAGTGADTLVGGTGQNTFVVNAGDGLVTIRRTREAAQQRRMSFRSRAVLPRTTCRLHSKAPTCW